MRIIFLSFLLLTIPSEGLARSAQSFSYPYTWVWNASVRLLRVDLACPITEKDREDGYFLFKYAHEGKNYSGSVELIPAGMTRDEGVQVVIQVAGMPQFIERMIFTRLSRKLSEEYGRPVPVSLAERAGSRNTSSIKGRNDKKDPELVEKRSEKETQPESKSTPKKGD